jgi:uncharacterized protein YbaR (Trm112 family)
VAATYVSRCRELEGQIDASQVRRGKTAGTLQLVAETKTQYKLRQAIPLTSQESLYTNIIKPSYRIMNGMPYLLDLFAHYWINIADPTQRHALPPASWLKPSTWYESEVTDFYLARVIAPRRPRNLLHAAIAGAHYQHARLLSSPKLSYEGPLHKALYCTNDELRIWQENEMALKGCIHTQLGVSFYAATESWYRSFYP